MAQVTLRIVDGSDRGRVYDAVKTPITIGREEGNTIQLNDDRVSRFHIKIQEDHDKLVLTDLESTNGTKVNNETTQLRILRYGDLISVGRSKLLFGSRDQIAARLAALRGDEEVIEMLEDEDEEQLSNAVSLDLELQASSDSDMQSTLHVIVPPELPDRLDPVQAAQLSELIEFLQIRVRGLLDSVEVAKDEETVKLDQREWQNLLDLQARLAVYLREISEPRGPK